MFAPTELAPVAAKHNITLAIDGTLLKRARALACIAFVDRNVLIYAHDRSAGVKRDRAVAICVQLWSERMGCLSVQVLQEFFVAVTRKLRTPVARAQAREVVRAYSPWVPNPTSTSK